MVKTMKIVSTFILTILLQNLNTVYSHSSEVPCAISEEEWTELDKLLMNEEQTIIAASESLDLIFDILAEFAGELVYQCKAEIDQSASQLNQSLIQITGAYNSIVESIKIALRVDSESYVAVFLEELRPELAKIYNELFPEIIALAKCGNFYENRKEIEQLGAHIYATFAKVELTIYETVRLNCHNSEDEDISAAINSAEVISLKSLRQTTDALFNSLKILSYEVTTGNKSPLIILAIENNRNLAKIAAVPNLGSIYSLLEALVTYRYVNKPGTAVLLGQIYSDLTLGSVDFKTGTQIIFKAINLYLTAINLGLKDAGTDEFSSAEIIQAIVIAQYNDGIGRFFDLISKSLTVDSKDEKAVAAQQNNEIESVKITELVVPVIFELIAIAQDCKKKDSKELEAEIEALEAKADAAAQSYVESMFEAICGNYQFDEETGDVIELLRKDSIKRFEKYLAAIEDAISILINAYLNDSVSKEDFEAVKADETKANEALESLITNFATLLRVILTQATEQAAEYSDDDNKKKSG